MVQLCLNRHLNMRNGPSHLKIRMELASQSGPASTYLNVVPVGEELPACPKCQKRDRGRAKILCAYVAMPILVTFAVILSRQKRE